MVFSLFLYSSNSVTSNNLNVSPLEINFPKSYILLVHSTLPNCRFKIARKKKKIPYPRCGFGACLRCGRATKTQRLQSRWDMVFFLFLSIRNLQIKFYNCSFAISTAFSNAALIPAGFFPPA